MSNRAERRRAEKFEAKRRAHTAKVFARPDRQTLNLPKLKPEVLAGEKLVSCAILHGDGQISKGFKSHYELRSSLGYEDPMVFKRGDIPGFWTSDQRFVERNEAMNIAYHAGQIKQRQEREFLSSDVDIW